MQAQGGYKLQVEPLSYNNFPQWKSRMQDVLLREGLWGTVKPAAGEQLCTAEHHKALGLIRMHVDDSIRGELDSDELGTPAKVWAHLEQQYKEIAAVQSFQLRDEWHRMRQEGGEPIAAYATRIKQKAAQVKALGAPMDGTEMAMTLVRGLGPEYSILRSTFKAQPNLARSVDAVVPPLLSREQELREELGEEPVAFTAAKAQQQLQRRPFSSRATPQQQAGRSQGRGREGARGTPGWNGKHANVECWDCGQWGHFSDKCPNPSGRGGRGGNQTGLPRGGASAQSAGMKRSHDGSEGGDAKRSRGGGGPGNGP